MKLRKIFTRKRGPQPVYVQPARESSPDVHQLNSSRKRPNEIRRPPRREDSASIPSCVVMDDEHQPCVRCRAIDFPAHLDWQPKQARPWVPLIHTLPERRNGNAVVGLRMNGKDEVMEQEKDTTAMTTCPYCLFFRMMIGPLPDNTGKFTPYLRIRHAFERMGVSEKHELGRAPLVEVTTRDKGLPWGYVLKAFEEEHESGAEETDPGNMGIYTRKVPGLWGRTVPSMLDPAILKTWLGFCDEHHEGTCGLSSGGIQVPVEGLRLIDCEQGGVVTAAELVDPNVPYAAFSYARDNVTAEHNGDNGGMSTTTTEGTIQDRLPRVCTDAMALTKQLGLRYLFIEECCTPLDEPSRRKQLHNIGEIFRRAYVTLIAATSPSSPAGLPGVSHPREEQLSLRTPSGLFTTSLLRPDLEVNGTRWARQARTYQEGLLSRRRVIFTESQAYFQCQSVHCHESIGVSLHLAPGLNLGRVFPENGAGTSSPEDVQSTIARYIPREATSDRDRWDAFKGIARHYEQLPVKPVSSLLGVPLFNKNEFGAEGLSGSNTDSLAVGLSWVSDHDPIGKPYHDPLYLHGGFPSWTWLAWRCREAAHESTTTGYRIGLLQDTAEKPAPASSSSMTSTPATSSVTTVTPAAATSSTTTTTTTNRSLLGGISAPPKMEISVGFADNTLRSWEIERDVIMKKRERITHLHMTTFCFDITIKEQPKGKLTIEGKTLSKGMKERCIVWLRAAHPDIPLEPEEEWVDDGSEGGVNVDKPLPDPKASSVSSVDTPVVVNGDGLLEGKAEEVAKEHKLLGVIVSGRGWKEDAKDVAITALICSSLNAQGSFDSDVNGLGHEGKPTSAEAIKSKKDGPMRVRRVGALEIKADSWASLFEGAATIKSVRGIGAGDDLAVELRDVDVY